MAKANVHRLGQYDPQSPGQYAATQAQLMASIARKQRALLDALERLSDGVAQKNPEAVQVLSGARNSLCRSNKQLKASSKAITDHRLPGS